jgi:ribosome-associated protein
MDINNVKVKAILEWLTEKKADAISTYDLTQLHTYTDYIIVCEGQADLHARAIGQHLLDMCKENHLHVLSKEGLDYAHWVLVDLGDVIVHVFMPETRAYYKIDEFIKSYSLKTETTEN